MADSMKDSEKEQKKAERAALFESIEKSEAAKKEEETVLFWKEQGIFEKSLEKEAPNGEFVFYDGPPFANGLPHSGSLLSSVSKDLIPRYKTMRGYRVRRRWGWDTHGLPIESAVEKKLGLKNKKEILALGIENFNETARGLVLEYVDDWKKYVDRIGRWVDFDNSYKTMDTTFMESVWWSLKQIHEKGLLYEGRKVLMYCPHCETPLAKAEIAMDNTYKDVTEEAATVKFKVTDASREKLGLPENTFILAWTTTPWTLPGNVALAVGPEMQYAMYEKDGEHFVLAPELAEKNGFEKSERTFVGAELVGISYEPLYEIQKVAAAAGKKWEVVPADFVTAEDGTGVVHTAVIYGEDDYVLGLAEGLPMVPLLAANGTYNVDAPEFIQGKYFKKAEADIKEDLETRGLLFAKNSYTHSYPHCYRCGTALFYNAVSSWFINIQKIKDRMLATNEDIAWMPDFLKHGRFQHNLETAPDWTISRNRFWATPLPIWKDAKGSVTVVGSLEELKARTKKSGNTYYTMRHGQADANVTKTSSTDFGLASHNHLTETGIQQAKDSAKAFAHVKFDRIIVSPFARTIETAQLVAEELGFPVEKIEIDERLREFSVGEWEGKTWDEIHTHFANMEERFTVRPEGGENFIDVRRRVGEFLYELEAKNENQTILIISHGDPIWLLRESAMGTKLSTLYKAVKTGMPHYAEIEKLDFVPLPHTADYELDFHLPYIDQIQLEDEEGNPLTRIPEVVDCWVESGAMPFAEYNYPFANKEEFEKRAPGDFVSEYIAQTRAWFYYMHAMSVALFDRAAFRNVVTTGTLLAADGEKVSKSKQNYTDPYVLFDRFSADAFRYYLMSSVLMQAEDLHFKDDEVKEIQNRVVNMLRNVLAFYDLFKQEFAEKVVPDVHMSPNILDKWILSRLAEVIENATTSFDAYDVPHATRPMREFIEDLSTWYVRRSRDRVKGTDAEDKQYALATLRYVLTEFSKCIAPVMPFVAEEVFQSVRNEADVESVHLAVWPGAVVKGSYDQKILLADMQSTRDIASEALMLRQKSGIKVRQPLAKLMITGELSEEFAAIVCDELNVKEVVGGATEMSLDTGLTPELIREGDMREFMRALAEARKELGLTQQDTVSVTISEYARAILEGQSISGVSEVTYSDAVLDGATAVTFSIGAAAFSISRI